MIHPTDRAQRRALKNKLDKKVKTDAYKKRRKEELEIEEIENAIRAAKAGIQGTDPGRDDGIPTRVGITEAQSAGID